MSRRSRIVRNVVVLLVGVVLVAVVLRQSGTLGARPATSSAGNAGTGLTMYPGNQGIPLPDVSGRTITGGRLSLRSLRGHVLVLNVWGSWCAPCRAEAPDLARISKATAPRGVRFVGIDVRDNAAAGRAFERRFKITYPSFDDANGLVLAQFTGIIPVSAVPSTIVVDRQGLIRARVVGRAQGSLLRGLVEDTEKLR